MTRARPHCGRFQAQGAGLEKSESWAQDEPLSVDLALRHLEQLKSSLSPAELKARLDAFDEAAEFIRRAHRAGGIQALFKKSFPRVNLTNAPRVDIEVNSGTAFV